MAPTTLILGLLLSVAAAPADLVDRALEAMEAEKEEADDGGLRAMIGPGSLALLEQDASFARYRFKPVSDDKGDAKLYEHLIGTLRVVKDGPYIDRVELKSEGPFSPAFSVKLNEFSLVLTFSPQGGKGTVLPRAERFRMSGRAMVVKKIEMAVDVRYGGYEFLED